MNRFVVGRTYVHKRNLPGDLESKIVVLDRTEKTVTVDSGGYTKMLRIKIAGDTEYVDPCKASRKFMPSRISAKEVLNDE